jgi:hypothetical protein
MKQLSNQQHLQLVNIVQILENYGVRGVNSLTTSSLNAASSPSLRLPSGMASMPTNNLNRLVAVRYSVSAACLSSQTCTTEVAVRFHRFEMTFVSRMIIQTLPVRLAPDRG